MQYTCFNAYFVKRAHNQISPPQSPSLRTLVSSSRGRANRRSLSCFSIHTRDPDQPVHSLQGPPVPPRKRTRPPTQPHSDPLLSRDKEEEGGMRLRRSTSEGKVDNKEEKRRNANGEGNKDRAAKARSVHFDGGEGKNFLERESTS